MLRRLLIVTAVDAERAAVLAGIGENTVYPDPLADDAVELSVATVGFGPTAAAAGTARLLALAEAEGAGYTAVVCAGVAGGFAGRAAIGDVVLATASVAADLGSDSPDGFLPVDTLGFGTGRIAAVPDLLYVPTARRGEILTVTTATGTGERAAALARTHPGALAEAMEGFGAATAAAGAGLPYAEIRAISNLVGPRDMSAWQLPTAFAALTAAFTVPPAAGA